MLETRVRRSPGVTLGDAQCLVEGRRRAGIVGQAPFLRGSSSAIATYIHIFTEFNIHIFTKFNKLQIYVRVFS